MTQKNSLEEYLNPSRSQVRACLIDSITTIPYSVTAGAVVDSISGFTGEAVFWSRLSAVPVNMIVNPLYGFWREHVYATTDTYSNSSIIKRYLSDILAYNTCRTFLHGVVVVAGSFIANDKVDWQSVANGLVLLTVISPFVCLLANGYMDFFRRHYHVNTPLQRVYLDKS